MLEVHLDPVGGIAGDMFVATLLDFRPDLAAGLIEALSFCPLIDGVEFELAAHNDGILTGKRFVVRRHGRRAEVENEHQHHHHHHRGGHHHHRHDHHNHADHHHVHWHEIREALDGSDLDRETVEHAIGIFTHLAEAEANVHGVDPEHVRFHEVGAWDSIADIVAAAWLIARIGAVRWTVGALPLGSGRVRTAHGLLPVPAPATALLMQGFATIDDGVAGERVTPTGAAILRHLCKSDLAVRSPRRLVAAAHGFGTKRLPGISNCLRLLAFEPVKTSVPTDQVAVLECDIDDQSGEDLAQAIDNLRASEGVLDVVQMPVFGKKGRMMTHLRILAAPAALEDTLAAVFDETTTIGIRHSLMERSVLRREATTTEVGSRRLRVKLVERPSGRTAKLEADELHDVAGHAARSSLRRLAEDRIEGDEE
ncbi:LarC family nickel insertion protein [Rhizobium sp. P38BS-XIX]|uniref:LarC family nickel insertion protein n=1 Tax=Rhizobium sp. P38BS-XIX TaxID=2726740 RepID=UPI0014579397|nr:LarC family nickel insertion protein [Rhizobium sp. P38BS-XIX]NLS00893.1 LarC family nickel insertion protein [Rhizobium sp. P38BS-XIX]